MLPTVNWSQPQRQPASGLVLALLKSLGSLLKGLWPFILIAIFSGNDEEEKKSVFLFSVLAAVTVLLLVSSLVNFFFFRFYIQEDELIIKKGWLKKVVLTVPLQKIQAVHIEQGPLHQLLNIVKLSADTAGSSKTEVTIQALRKPMAEALRERLSAQQRQPENESEHTAPTYTPPLFILGEKDLLKLAISANHVEAFFILLSAAYGIFENIKTVNEQLVDDAERWLPAGSVPVLLFLFISVLTITLFISTTRIFFKFYGFAATQSPQGMQLKSGLANTRERFVAFSKVQFISWRANWLRRRLGLWLFRYHTAGDDDVEKKMKAEVPITQKPFISLLAQPYHPVPDTTDVEPILLHRAYAQRHTLMVGLVPSLIAIIVSFYWWDFKSFYFLLWPLFIYWQAWLFQRHFRLWVFEDVAYLHRGVWGREALLVKWEAVQTISVSQNLYQRRKSLANLTLYTAAGNITVPYIPSPVAQQLMNYTLYKVESEKSRLL